jgi:hypothetical protein
VTGLVWPGCGPSAGLSLVRHTANMQRTALAWCFGLERVTGIEPALSAWECAYTANRLRAQPERGARRRILAA